MRFSAGAGLPQPLRRFYHVADGLQLPFTEVYPSDRVTAVVYRRGVGDAWLAFGRTPYFCDLLCRTDPDPGPRLAVWDRDSATPVEAIYDDVVDLLADLYAEYLDDGDRRADLRITAVPGEANRAQLIAVIKQVTPMHSIMTLRVQETPSALVTAF